MQVLVPDQNLTNNLVESKDKNMKIVDEIQNLLKSVGVGVGVGVDVDVEVANNVDVDDDLVNKNTNSTISTDKSEIENAKKNDSCHPSINSHTPFPGISKITSNLYLCGAGVAMPHILDQLNVNFIINVAPELPDTPLSTESKPLYLRIDALDRPEVDLSIHFDDVADMIEEVRLNDGVSLIHCVAGVSRSATFCIAYLMKQQKMSLREAYQHVKSIRPQIRPNSGFFQQLMRYESELYDTTTVKMVFYESLNKEIPDVYEPEYRAMEEFYQHQRQRQRQRKTPKI